MDRNVIVLDTHALLWWALDPEQLSEHAAQTCAEMERAGGFASSISIWELGTKIKRGKLELGITIDELVRRLERSAVVELVPVDTSIWLRSLALAWEHRDPADRVIVATALAKSVPLMTKDDAIRGARIVATVW
jgi:PIN domain nuclease of toxin-antitoxin system